MGGRGQAAVGGSPPVRIKAAVERADTKVVGGRRRGIEASIARIADVVDHDRVARGSQLPEGGGERALIGEPGQPIRNRAGLAMASEKDACERRAGGVVPAGPPHHDAMAGPGHGHVQQPQLLAGPLLLRRRHLVAMDPTGAADADAASSASVMEHRRRLVVAPRSLPQGREQHDGELEALGSVDGLHGHCGDVGFEPTTAGVGVPTRAGDHLLAQPPDQHGRRRGAGLGRLVAVQQLGHMAEVAQSPVAVGGGPQPGGEALGELDPSQQSGDTANAQDQGPVM